MEQSAEVIAAMRQMLAQNAAAAEAVVAGARAEREKAAAERAAARQALADTKQKSDEIAAEFYQEHHTRIEKDIREMLKRDFADRLLRAGTSVHDVVELLGAPELQVADLARHIGYVALKLPQQATPTHAMAIFEDQGRGGYLSLIWDGKKCRFWYEIAAAPAISLLEIPRAEQWEAQTNIPLEQRREVLRFLGEQMLTRHTPGRQYRIEVDSVVVF